MGEDGDSKNTPLLLQQSSGTRQGGRHPHKRTGTLWSAVAHIITGVIGSGVLSLAWSLSQLGWIAGPIAMLVFAFITLLSAFLLCNCYWSPDPEHGPVRNPSYLEAVYSNLGETRAWLCGFFVHINLYGIGIAYTITSAISIRAIQESNCYHKQGHQAACNFGDAYYMLIFGFVQIFMSQIPNMHDIKWVSLVAAIMSFTYSLIVLGLGIARVIENGMIKGSIEGIPTATVMEKVWLVAQGVGDIAFAYPYSLILIEIQDTLKSPPSENETMKKASTISVALTTFFYLLCGGFGYAAFGVDTPGNLMTGFYEPYWLIDIANACIVLHLVGGYQVFSQPLFAAVDRWFAQKFPDNEFLHHSHTLKLPLLPPLRVNLYRLCIRTAYVASTTILAVAFPYFNQVLGILGALIFWPLSIYFPVEMYLKQRNIEAWTGWWIALRTFSYVCLVVTIFALSGSIGGLVNAKLS
ncbi:probable amino acid permease 7 [Chenopodium quinoa]|uniref:probable amino acid permease 7 n=1 Tax=Chenopodium quinoa TaxID=63459 RepID=UPI000B786EAD|nr:probable amino acid permease 7 [Chenopodium quinoa]